MSYKICIVPLSPIRRESLHKSEMVSQLVFGETCIPTGEIHKEWVGIKTGYEGYAGWCQESHLAEITADLYNAHPVALTHGWVNTIQFNGLPMKLPFGCCLPALEKGVADWNGNRVVFRGRTWDIARATRDETTIRFLACQYLNTAYLWGGKTVFGVDCSGFTQTVLRFLGIPVLRDAWQQAEQGDPVASLEVSRCGDLAFFNQGEGKISHVGILFNCREIIHASGKVRVDKIDESGIVPEENSGKTHYLRGIRRYF